MAESGQDSETAEVPDANSDMCTEMSEIDLETVREVVYRGVSHTFSIKWQSDIEKETTRLSKLLLALTRLAPESFLFPMALRQWIDHRIAILLADKRVVVGKIEAMFKERPAVEFADRRITPPFHGKSFKTLHSPVLARPTIWNTWNIPSHKPCAGWPKHQELKWEGEDRKMTGVGRYLPLPREPGNETVAWHHLKMVPSYELDAVRRLEDLIGQKADRVDDDDGLGRMLIGDLLWHSMDDPF